LEYFEGTGRAGFTWVPVSFHGQGSSASIAGYAVEETPEGPIPLSAFHLTLRRGEDGRWRIAVQSLTKDAPPIPTPATALQLLRELDAAGVGRAAVLSVAFWFASPLFPSQGNDEQRKVQLENDWVAEQVAQSPARLIGFCSLNPLSTYAVDELRRCTERPQMRGLKLHFGNSGVDMLNDRHVARVRQLFEEANTRRVPIIVHLWTGSTYGAAHSRAFLDNILPVSPNIVIQIAHMAASGPDYHSDEAFEVFASAAARGDSRMKNVFTDVASMVTQDTSEDSLALVARRLRQFGIRRVLFGSDRAGNMNDAPQAAWSAFRRLPLSQDEFSTIARNGAPYLH
jgi:predicted TIM-barrel fold metal-dependent hydrolase